MRRHRRAGTLVPLFSTLLALGCDDTSPPGTGPDSGPTPVEPDAGSISFPDSGHPNAPPGLDAAPLLEPFPHACADVYDQNTLPTFEVDMAPSEWEALQADQALRPEREAAGLVRNPWHPVHSVSWGDLISGPAMIKLKGHHTWYDPKLQFVISFNEEDPHGRFLGLRKLVLDMPSSNRSFLRDRLAFYYLRRLGVPAACANNAKLIINGDYYGLYTNVEKLDKEYLERAFEDDTGNLYEEYLPQNNEAGDHSDVAVLQAAIDPDELAAIANMDEVLLDWAGEAVIPQGDGYWAGRDNYYLYHDGIDGWAWLPWDLDATFDRISATANPLLYHASNEVKHPHLAALLEDAAWTDRFIDAIQTATDAHDVDHLQSSIDAWAAQIADAAQQDPTRDFTLDQHLAALSKLRTYLRTRHNALSDWLACAHDPDAANDADNDGLPWCLDCDESTCGPSGSP